MNGTERTGLPLLHGQEKIFYLKKGYNIVDHWEFDRWGKIDRRIVDVEISDCGKFLLVTVEKNNAIDIVP